jgi:hypothetical protein
MATLAKPIPLFQAGGELGDMDLAIGEEKYAFP